ncbi:MAG: D-glycerate dehydrogenase [Confluentimicrobium sp.]|nr:D-glycerate dehydrogenase [Actibacterium sp.]|tara:strand:- start:847 stop:1800 length:954 start_codon:yes stop_codon:yes gene_type:complete
MPRILITRAMPDATLARAATLGEVVLEDTPAGLSPDAARAALAAYDIIVPTLGDRFTAEAFAGGDDPRCKLLANFGMGYNHIDIAAAQAAGIAVTNTPGAVTDATADVALMLMLMACRRASEGEAMVRAGRWPGWQPTQLLGLHMTGKRLGVIGMGNIGQAVARRAHYGFGMQVLYHNRSAKQVDFPAQQVADLHEMLGQVDVAVVAVPASPATRHLIDAAALAAMQPHARLVNIARGDIVDETALIAALQGGRLGGAGLDVYEHEPEVPQALRDMPNVSLLPHLGTSALEVREAMGAVALDNVEAHLAGRDLPNAV